MENNNNPSPYIRHDQNPPEFTLKAIILGILIAVIFGAANAYLALRVSMTVSASIPAAVISMAILKSFFKNSSILENNMVQTIGSSGESLVAGVIFTLPALIFLGLGLDYMKIFLFSIAGCIIGVLLMIPLRYYLVNKEHRNLPFPEGTACAEVLIAGQEKGNKAQFVFSGLALGAFYKFCINGFRLIKDIPAFTSRKLHLATLEFELSPILLGVGYLIGPRISAVMLAGGLLGWVVFLPAIHLIGENLAVPIYPAGILISEMGPYDIWNFYLRYIGAGGVAIGGFLSIIKSLPIIINSFKRSIEGIKNSINKNSLTIRTEKDLNLRYIIAGLILVSILILAVPAYNINLLGLAVLLAFSFFFVAVSSRIVGLIGSTSQPVSGMTISALIVVAVLFLGIYGANETTKAASISISAIICIAICLSGDMAQDLKTGFLVGATPYRQQYGELIGTLISSFAVGYILILLHKAYELGSRELPAVQSRLMADIVDGIMGDSLPWVFIFIGVMVGLIVELLGISALPFAIGLYLPISTSSPIIFGGLLYWFVDRKMSKKHLNDQREVKERGTLFASGLIAGDALMGILLGFLTVFTISGKSVIEYFHIREIVPGALAEDIISFLIFLGLIAFFYLYISRKKEKQVSDR